MELKRLSPFANAIFVSWSPYSGRSEFLAKYLEVDLYLIHFLKFKRPLLAAPKYVLQAIETARVLLMRRPKVIFVEVPPVVAALVVFIYCCIFKASYVIDSHSGTFVSWKWRWLLPLQRFLSRRSLVTIVTNSNLAKVVENWGSRVLVVPIVVPQLSIDVQPERSSEQNIVVVNSFSDDEPLLEILNAAKMCRHVQFYVTGDLKRCPRWAFQDRPPNVRFTSFLPTVEYYGKIASATGVMALTKRQDTLLLGAYEALALERPMILSDSEVLRANFSTGCIFAMNDATSIVAAVNELIMSRDSLELKIRDLKKQVVNKMNSEIFSLVNIVTQTGGWSEPNP
jgi:hypothetical protein